MNTEFTSDRMLGYLYHSSQPSLEEVVEEMLAIISDRDRLVAKHKSEHAQSRLNMIYRNGYSTPLRARTQLWCFTCLDFVLMIL